MIYFPLIFFLVFFFSVYKRNGFDVSAFIVLLYIITSFFAIVLFSQDVDYVYGNYSTFDVSFIPTIVYCFMIGLCILPITTYGSNKPRALKQISHIKLFNIITSIYFLVFVALLIIFAEDLVFRFVFGDLGELRDLAYEGELLNAQDKFTGPLRFVSTIFTLLGDGAFFMLVFFFYSVCALKNSNLKNIAILLSSLSPVILGFVNIDRSKTAFWIICFAISFVLFRPYIPKERMKFFKKLSFVVLGVLFLYLISVTISRFGDMDEGTKGGLLSYLGQPFINFCEIWNKVDIQTFHTERILPLTNYILGNDGSALANELRAMYTRTGVHLNVFFSFVGMFLVDLGQIGAILLPPLLCVVSQSIVNKVRYRSYVSLDSFILVFGLSCLLGCGIITYFYSTMSRTLSLIFFFIIARKLR